MIRDQGLCPCPWCIIPKVEMDKMGTKPDDTSRLKKAQEFLQLLVAQAQVEIYHAGSSITGIAVERLLKATSSVPTMVCESFLFCVTCHNFWAQNTFVRCLGNGFDISRMLVVDMMHKFELGVWKALFTHLLRVLYAASGPCWCP